MTLWALCFKICSLSAEVAELVDAHGSGPCGSNPLRVQVPSSACQKYKKPLSYTQGFLVFTARRCVPLNPEGSISGHWGVPLGPRNTGVHRTPCAPSSALFFMAFHLIMWKAIFLCIFKGLVNICIIRHISSILMFFDARGIKRGAKKGA